MASTCDQDKAAGAWAQIKAQNARPSRNENAKSRMSTLSRPLVASVHLASERERESARLIRVSSPVQDEHEQVLAYQRSRNSLTSSLVACGVPILYFCTWRIMLPTSVNITSALPSTMSAVASAPISTPKS